MRSFLDQSRLLLLPDEYVYINNDGGNDCHIYRHAVCSKTATGVLNMVVVPARSEDICSDEVSEGFKGLCIRYMQPSRRTSPLNYGVVLFYLLVVRCIASSSFVAHLLLLSSRTYSLLFHIHPSQFACLSLYLTQSIESPPIALHHSVRSTSPAS